LGHFSLPPFIPTASEQIVMSRDSRLTISLPNPGVVGKDGLAVLIYASDNCQVQTTLLCGDARHERPAQRLATGQWEPLFIALDIQQPVTTVELHAKPSVGNKSIVLHAATAVITTGRSATIRDLDVIPGGLRALPLSFGRDRDSDYRFIVSRLVRQHPTFAEIDHIAVAYPNSTTADELQLYSLLTRITGSQKAAGLPRLLTYSDGTSRDAAFEQAAGKVDLFYMMVSTANAPQPGKTASEITALCKKSLSVGTLTVLVLTHHKAADATLTTAWDNYLAAIVAEVPLLPIIDLATAPIYAKRNHLPINGDGVDTDHYLEDCLTGGAKELVARLRWIINLSGERPALLK
jgi:hypothetical protein